MTLTFGSLFSGIGGLDLGLERAGMRCRWQVEVDDYCRRVLTKHWPDVPKYGDIREVTGDELERVDLICGGFPCQDISIAGKRVGIGGERSGLWSEYIRLVRVVRPRFVLVENVPNLLALGMGRVLGDLAESGYDAEWDCIPATAVGAHHLRDRAYIVAYAHGIGLERRIYERARVGVEALPTATLWRNPTPPYVCRGTDGIPNWLDRLRVLGNAVVPQVAEWIGRRIVAVAS